MLNEFFSMMQRDPDRAFYGYKHVLAASQKQAIDVMLVTDALFRSNNVAERRKYSDLVDEVKQAGGSVRSVQSPNACLCN